jgi:hypothetical protein
LCWIHVGFPASQRLRDTACYKACKYVKAILISQLVGRVAVLHVFFHLFREKNDNSLFAPSRSQSFITLHLRPKPCMSHRIFEGKSAVVNRQKSLPGLLADCLLLAPGGFHGPGMRFNLGLCKWALPGACERVVCPVLSGCRADLCAKLCSI